MIPYLEKPDKITAITVKSAIYDTKSDDYRKIVWINQMIIGRLNAALGKLVSRQTFNLEIRGSNPLRSTKASGDSRQSEIEMSKDSSS